MTNILLVVDDGAVRKSMVEFLKIQRPRYKVYTATNGAGALKILEKLNADLVITSAKLPGLISGIELCKTINQKFQAEVIVCSEYATFEESAITSGASDFLIKPIRFEELLARINKVLEERKKKELAYKKSIESILKYKELRSKASIERAIEFPPEYYQAGVSILSYFGNVLSKKYPDQKPKVTIIQDGLRVVMVVDTLDGNKDIIEKELNDYGLVITGKKSIEEYTNDKLLAVELRHELRLAKVRIETQKEIINYQNTDLQTLKSLLQVALTKEPAIINLQVPVSARADSKILQIYNISPQIDRLAESLNNLKKQLAKGSKERNCIEDIIKSVIKLKRLKSKDEIRKSTALSKIRKFLEDVKKTESVVSKVIKTTKDGIKLVKIIAACYNEILKFIS